LASSPAAENRADEVMPIRASGRMVDFIIYDLRRERCPQNAGCQASFGGGCDSETVIQADNLTLANPGLDTMPLGKDACFKFTTTQQIFY
jgi:hypothetical protein